MMRRVKLLCSLIILLAGQGAQAVSYPLPPEGSRLVGSPLTITVPPANTQPLEAFAAQYGQGLSNMLVPDRPAGKREHFAGVREACRSIA